MEVAFCLWLSLITRQADLEEQRRSAVPGTLRLLFAGGVEPIHCPLRTTCCTKSDCIIVKMDRGRFRIVTLDRIHISSIARNQQDRYFIHRTLGDAFKSWRCGLLAKIWR